MTEFFKYWNGSYNSKPNWCVHKKVVWRSLIEIPTRCRRLNYSVQYHYRKLWTRWRILTATIKSSNKNQTTMFHETSQVYTTELVLLSIHYTTSKIVSPELNYFESCSWKSIKRFFWGTLTNWCRCSGLIPFGLLI